MIPKMVGEKNVRLLASQDTKKADTTGEIFGVGGIQRVVCNHPRSASMAHSAIGAQAFNHRLAWVGGARHELTVLWRSEAVAERGSFVSFRENSLFFSKTHEDVPKWSLRATASYTHGRF